MIDREEINVSLKEIDRTVEDIVKKWELGIKLFPFEKIILSLYYNLKCATGELKRKKNRK